MFAMTNPGLCHVPGCCSYDPHPAKSSLCGSLVPAPTGFDTFLQTPVPVNREQLNEEVQAVKKAVQELCPLHLTLERVTINPAGVVMACWQLSRGTTTTQLRESIQVGAQLRNTTSQSAPTD